MTKIPTGSGPGEPQAQTNIFDLIRTASGELGTIEDILGLRKDVASLREEPAPDVPHRLRFALDLMEELGSRLRDVKVVLINMRDVFDRGIRED